MKNIAFSHITPYRPYYLGTQPEYLHAAYASSIVRAPRLPMVRIPQTLSEVTGPTTNDGPPPRECDLTNAGGGREAHGQRIVVSGRVLDENAIPLRNTLLEIWQANAAGRYVHDWDQHDAPLDPNFAGVGHTQTDDNGQYRFVTIRPGCYPWKNHYNAWRPAHIHFSLFGPCIATRLVTQMYFPGDPLLDSDPIFNCTGDPIARQSLVSKLDWEMTVPDRAIGFRFDIILRGREATPFEANHK
jgi:protocatechuate 3,4-dioxygenase beta subunit